MSFRHKEKFQHSWPRYSSESIASKMKNRPFVVFIRDVPEFGHVPLATRLLTELAKHDLIPVYFYSVLELMKDPKNLNTMKSFSLKNSQSSKERESSKGLTDAVLIAKGCNGVMKCLFERAITRNGFDPKIVIVDYLSETFVDVERLAESAKKLEFQTFFLKKRLEQDSVNDVKNIVGVIASTIKFQNQAEIRFQRDADKYWHELQKIFIPIEKDNSMRKIENYHLSNYLKKLPSISKNIFSSHHPTYEECVKDQAEKYYSQLENLAKMLDGDLSNNLPQNVEGISSGPNHTLLVIDDYHFRRPGHARLFQVFMEEFVKENIPFHVVPIGELVIMPKFQNLFTWFCMQSDMNMPNTYSYLFLDAFNMLYSQKDTAEKVVILDNIHEKIVTSSYYIRRALEKKWEILILKRNQCWPSNDDEIILAILQILRRKYSTNVDCDNNFSTDHNNAFGDYFL